MDNASSGVFAILMHLLSAAGWHGSDRRVFEAVPHMSDDLSAEDVVQTLKNLEIPATSAFGNLRQITKEDCPSLFIDRRGTMQGVIDARNGKLLVCELGSDNPRWLRPPRRSGQLVRLEKFDIERSELSSVNLFEITRSFGGLFPWLFVASLLTNIMGLATPLLIMVIYDRVIPSESTHLIAALGLAMLIAVATDFCFRMARARAIAHIGSETERQLSHALVRKIMALQLSQIEQTDVERQLARFKQFESLREVFTGQVLSSVLDLPFVLIFLAVLAWIAPWIAFLIGTLALIFIVAAASSLPAQQALNKEAALQNSTLQAHVFETTKQQHEIQRLGLTATWAVRNQTLVARSAAASRRARQFQMIGQALAQSLMAVAGVGAIVISTLSAMSGNMSFGALIAVMSLVWKILTPIVALYSGTPQVFGYFRSKRQVDRVLALSEERTRGAGKSHQKRLHGKISVSSVTFRYSSTGAVALSQASLDIEAHEFVYLSGENNSGKSTLMGLISGLYQTNVGAIALDGIDIRQIAVDDLRQSITYAKRHSEHFYGTIYQNFRLAAPDITEDEVKLAIENMELKDEILGLPEGLHTRLTEAYRTLLPEPTMRALALARCFARDSSIYMFNDPTAGLDSRRQAALASCLEQLRANKKTVILASVDENLLPIAGRFVFMQDGRIVADHRGSSGRRKIKALLDRNRGYAHAKLDI